MMCFLAWKKKLPIFYLRYGTGYRHTTFRLCRISIYGKFMIHKTNKEQRSDVLFLHCQINHFGQILVTEGTFKGSSLDQCY